MAANAVMQAGIDLGYSVDDLTAMRDIFLATGYIIPPLPVAGFAVLLAAGAGWLGKALDRVQVFERWARWLTALVIIGAGVYETLRSTFYLI